MGPARNNLKSLRLVALWWLTLCVVFGPAGIGGTAAFAAVANSCEVSCPCDEAARVESVSSERAAADSVEAVGSGERAAADSGIVSETGSEPCEDDCPENCPDCGCCFGVAMAVSSPGSPLVTSRTSTAAGPLIPSSRLAVGECKMVFRPPRALT